MIGLSLGYLGLLKIGGMRYDFLEIGDRLPAWATKPIPLDFLKGKTEEDADAPNERSLKKLLDESAEPPAVDRPDHPAAIQDAPPFPASPFDAVPPLPAAPIAAPTETAPPFAPSSPLAPDAPSPPPPAEPATSTPPTHAPPPEVRVGPRHFTPYSAEDLALAVAEVSGR